MCTSIVYNGKKTMIGWNLDILDMEYQVVADHSGTGVQISGAPAIFRSDQFLTF